MTEAYYEKPYWVVDLLPEQVPPDSPGRYFAVEGFYLEPPRYAALRRRFADILLKLYCYYDMEAGGPEDDAFRRDIDPERLYAWITDNKRDLRILLPEERALIALDRDDICITVYDPSPVLLRRIGQLAAAEGLFVWQPPRGEDKNT